MKPIVTSLCLSLVALMLSSCYIQKPFFDADKHSFNRGFHGGPFRYDNRHHDTAPYGGSGGEYRTEYPSDGARINQ